MSTVLANKIYVNQIFSTVLNSLLFYFQQTGSANITNHTFVPRDHNLPIDDEDDFSATRDAWKSVLDAIHIIYRLNMVLAVLLSILAIVPLLSIFNENVRRKSAIWYWFHLTALTVFLGICIHVPGYSGSMLSDKSLCLYVMYGVEYIFFLVAYILIFLNLEVVSLTMLRARHWQNNQFARFVISILVTWVCTCFIVGHVIIANNSASETGFCFRLRTPANSARHILREWIPTAICFVSSVAIFVIFCLQKTQPGFSPTICDFREITSLPDESDDRWSLMKMTLAMNSIYILRTIFFIVAYYTMKDGIRSPESYVVMSVVMLFHSQTFYWLPFPVLFIPEVRSALRSIFFQCISFFVGLYKGGRDSDCSNLPVRMGDVKEDA